MGRRDETFETEVIGIVRKHVPDLTESAVSRRAREKGNYVAVTVTITAISKQQLDNIYQELNAHEAVLMTL